MKKTMLDLIAPEGSRTRRKVAGLWRRYSLRGPSDDPAGLERLYALRDPWGMSTEREQSRFVQTNQVLASLAGQVGSLLEIGCGEGHQSVHLASLCERLHGLDLSERAVQRARQRLPQAQFAVGELSALPWAMPAGGKYDLVTACEVLYFFADVEAAVQRMSALGKACFVSFFSPTARLVGDQLAGLPGVQRGWIYHEPCAWLWAFWRPGSVIEP